MDVASPVRQLFPLYVVENLSLQIDFYKRYFSFSLIFHSEHYVHLVNDSGAQLAFMSPNQKDRPNHMRNTYTSGGAILSFEVDDAQYEFERLSNEDITIVSPYTEEKWGYKHFLVQDPSNIIIDIVCSSIDH